VYCVRDLNAGGGRFLRIAKFSKPCYYGSMSSSSSRNYLLVFFACLLVVVGFFLYVKFIQNTPSEKITLNDQKETVAQCDTKILDQYKSMPIPSPFLAPLVQYYGAYNAPAAVFLDNGQVYFQKSTSDSQMSLYRATSMEVLNGTAKPRLLTTLPILVSDKYDAFGFLAGVLNDNLILQPTRFLIETYSSTSTSYRLYAVDTESGKLSWYLPNSLLLGVSTTSAEVYAITYKTYHSNVSTYDYPEAFVALDPTSGKTLWNIPVRSPNDPTPVFLSGGLYLVDRYNGTVIRKIDIHSGKDLWQYTVQPSTQSTPDAPFLFKTLNNRLYYFADTNERYSTRRESSVYVLDEVNGKLLSKIPLKNSGVLELPAVCGGDIYFKILTNVESGVYDVNRLDPVAGKVDIL
jgi:outer membrane protein assembly factor BamB